ncbi:MAG: hypothetical protein ABIH57_01515, partial [Candidatus Omnitrophota bacterium]
STVWYTTNLFRGIYNVRAVAMDSAGNESFSATSPYEKPNALPQVGVIIPSSGSSAPGEEQIFTTTYLDEDGWEDIYITWLYIQRDGSEGYFWGKYNPNVNKVYVRTDDNNAWTTGVTPGVTNPDGTDKIIDTNSNYSLNCTKTEIYGSGNTMTIKWAATFKEPCSGNTYDSKLRAYDDTTASTSLITKGTWSVE